jgi:hypothetical protein
MTQPDTSRPEHRRAFEHLPAFAGFAAISVLYTYPLIRDFSTHVAGAGDSFQFLWDFWWVRTALFRLHQSFFHTDFIFYPPGVSLAFHEFSLLNCFLSLPLQPWLGDVGVYNLLILGTHVLGGFSAYLLVLHLTGCKKSGFVSGIVFSFSSFHFNHESRLHMASIQGLPLFVLFFLRFTEEPTPKRSAQAALLYIANSLTTWYYMVFLALWGAGVWAASGPRLAKQGKTRAWLRSSALFAGIVLIGIGPFLWPAVREVLGGQRYMQLNQSRDFSADIAALFYMPFGHVLTGGFFMPLYRELLTHPTEREVFLGYLPTLLALVAVARGHRPGRWVAAGAFFLILALGPHPQFRGVEYTSVTLPYFYLAKLPFLSAMRAPTRCLAMVSLFEAILAGLGCQRLFAWLERKPSGGKLAALAAALFTVEILAEQLQTPLRFPMTPARAVEHPLYQALRNEPANAAVLDLPLPWLAYPNPMFYQTIHQKKMLGGYVARASPEMWRFIRNSPFLRYLGRLPNYTGYSLFGFSELGELRMYDFKEPPSELTGPKTGFPPRRARRFLLRYGIRFVILHKVCYHPQLVQQLQRLFTRMGARMYFEDPTLLAYEIQDAAGP